jgi:hypothetical protein
MGKGSSSSSQANQINNTSSADNRIVNESGIVAQNSTLDLSTDYWASLTNNTTTSTNLSATDSHDVSNWTSLTNNTSTSSNTNLQSWDSSNKSTNLSTADSHNTSTWSSLTNNSSSVDNSKSSTVTGSYNTTLDAGVAKAALDYASNNDATVGAGFSSLLGWAKELSTSNTNSANNMVARFTDGVAQAYDTARNTTPGGIDNKTMVILGVAGAAAIGLMAMKGKN